MRACYASLMILLILVSISSTISTVNASHYHYYYHGHTTVSRSSTAITIYWKIDTHMHYFMLHRVSIFSLHLFINSLQHYEKKLHTKKLHTIHNCVPEYDDALHWYTARCLIVIGVTRALHSLYDKFLCFWILTYHKLFSEEIRRRTFFQKRLRYYILSTCVRLVCNCPQL